MFSMPGALLPHVEPRSLGLPLPQFRHAAFQTAIVRASTRCRRCREDARGIEQLPSERGGWDGNATGSDQQELLLSLWYSCPVCSVDDFCVYCSCTVPQ